MEKPKQIFPGGKTAAMRKKEQEKKEAVAQFAKDQKKRMKANEKNKHKEFLKNIGPATRLLIVRRGLRDFLTVMLMSICMGSGVWFVHNQANPEKKRISYTQAFKRAYDIRNLTSTDRFYHASDSEPDGIYTIAAMLLLMTAAGVGIRRMQDDKEKAKDFEEHILRETLFSSSTPLDDLMIYFHWVQHPNMSWRDNYYEVEQERLWKLNPVCKSIVENMASLYPVLFERLLSGNTRFASRDYAIAVISGYLKSHPDEFQRIMDVYVGETLPKSLVRKYAKKSNQR